MDFSSRSVVSHVVYTSCRLFCAFVGGYLGQVLRECCQAWVWVSAPAGLAD
jgi:hypothetical protein